MCNGAIRALTSGLSRLAQAVGDLGVAMGALEQRVAALEEANANNDRS